MAQHKSIRTIGFRRTGGTTAADGDMATQLAPEIGAGQTVDEEVDAVVAEEYGLRYVDPAAASLHF